MTRNPTFNAKVAYLCAQSALADARNRMHTQDIHSALGAIRKAKTAMLMAELEKAKPRQVNAGACFLAQQVAR